MSLAATNNKLSPLVTIGVPVYNGGADLECALRSLVAQDAPNIEILISDNASTDCTQEVCQRFAEADRRVRYHRNAENVGALQNFVSLVERARGKYFMWAAHDDLWSSNYVSALSEQLDANPAAVLATPKTVRTKPNRPQRPAETILPAPGGGRFENLKAFLRYDANVWVYGMYRSEWLKENAARMAEYPLARSDTLWLCDLILSESICGDADAVYYRQTIAGRRGGVRTTTTKIRSWVYNWGQLTKIAQKCCAGKDRWRALVLFRVFCLSHLFIRKNPFETATRIIKVAGILSRIGFEAGAKSIMRLLSGASQPTSSDLLNRNSAHQ